MDVTLRQLRYFVAVAEELSFTRAAARLHLSQPSLSVQIGRLERDAGATLLSRTSRSVALTPAGEALYEDARRLLADLDRALERARLAAGDATATLRIAYTASVAYRALPLILDELAAGPGGIEAVPRQEWCLRAVEAVLLGEADIALVREFEGGDDLATEVVRREPLAAFMSDRHPLAGRPALEIGDLRGHTVVVVPAALAPGFHGLVGRLCDSRGFAADEVEIANLENREPLLAHLSRHPDHLFAGPESMAGLAWEGIVHVPFADADARIGLSAVRRAGSPEPVVARALGAIRAVAAREGWDAPAP